MFVIQYFHCCTEHIISECLKLFVLNLQLQAYNSDKNFRSNRFSSVCIYTLKHNGVAYFLNTVHAAFLDTLTRPKLLTRWPVTRFQLRYTDGCDAVMTGIQMEVIDSCTENNGGCDQLCTHGPHGPICSCHYGYLLASDKTTCRGTTVNKQINK